MFETRQYGELRLSDTSRSGVVYRFGYLDDDQFSVFLDGLWHNLNPLDAQLQSLGTGFTARKNEIVWGDTAATVDPAHTDRGELNIRIVTWTPADATHIAHWLDRHDCLVVHPFDSSPLDHSKRETWHTSPSAAHLLELAICDGRVEAALRAEVEAIRTAFDKHEREWRERMRDRDGALIAKWDADIGAPIADTQIHCEADNDDTKY
jgi:hypothetical protein